MSGLSPIGIANLVATITSPRRFSSALPRYSSETPRGPYTSAVSNRVTPRSSAFATTARVCAWSQRMPKLLQPRPTTETRRPERPSGFVSMARYAPTERPVESSERDEADRQAVPRLRDRRLLDGHHVAGG